MHNLQTIFPNIPDNILTIVVNMHHGNINAASSWLLENDYRTLGNDIQIQHEDSMMSNSNSENDSYSEEDDSIMDHSQYEDNRFKRRRIRVQPTPEQNLMDDNERFWVCFDNHLMKKSHIELLNTNISNTSHYSVSLIAKSGNTVSGDVAKSKFVSQVFNMSNTNQVDMIKREITKKSPSKEKFNQSGTWGYWAHVFPLSDVDEVWRAMLSAHIFSEKHYFGDIFEIRSCPKSKHGEALPFHYEFSTDGNNGRTACLIVPCRNNKHELQRIGESIISTLRLNVPIFYNLENRNTKGLTIEGKEEHDRRNFTSLQYRNHVSTKEALVYSSCYKMSKTKEKVNAEVEESKINYDKYTVQRANMNVKFELYKLAGIRWIPYV